MPTKDRLLVLLQTLQEKSDDETWLTTADLRSVLEKEGYECSIRTLRRDMQSLHNVGYDISVQESDGMYTKYLEVSLSLLYGIMRGICSQLNIEQDDISGCVQYFRNEDTGNGCYALIYYDRTPGGAGHVKRLADPEMLHAALIESLKLMKQCNCGGADMDTSCYGCLRTYYNQKYHDMLKRGYVVRFLEDLLGNQTVMSCVGVNTDGSVDEE